MPSNGRKRSKPDFEILHGRNWQWMYLDKRYGNKGSGYISYRNVIAKALHSILNLSASQ